MSRNLITLAMILYEHSINFLFTLLAGETWWPELLKHSKKLVDNKNITIEEASKLNDFIDSKNYCR